MADSLTHTFNLMAEVDASGNASVADLDDIPIGDVSGVVSLTASAGALSKLFYFHTDASDISDGSPDDLLFACSGEEWPSLTYSQGPVTSSDILVTNNSSSPKEQVAYDMVRHLARYLTGTELGADLFDNEVALRTMIADQDSNIEADIKSKIDAADDNGSFASPKEATNVPTNASMAQIVFDNLLQNRRSLFNGAENSGGILESVAVSQGDNSFYKLPIAVGDKLEFRLQYTTVVESGHWYDGGVQAVGTGGTVRTYKVIITAE